MEELALRLLVPKELLVQWIEKARLVQLKGLGVENLRLLEAAGVFSITALAQQDPDELSKTIGQSSREIVPPQKAKIRIWVREAQKKVRSSP